ncbi:hypothetical protein NTH_00716 [Nitratireductor thuwali]|uniref:Uncharacterized protein n=1 Tax=Nitratireductor thuwali TaxID=2267699 RepID=A0ABY5MK56_9HYPH|nr:hypothetical protein NTH_00716 [Nitratireductor thuwali]
MKTFTRIALPLAAVLFASIASAQDAGKSDAFVSYPASQLNWIEIPDTGGIKYANVRGDLAGKGPYEAFVISPPARTIRSTTTPSPSRPWSSRARSTRSSTASAQNIRQARSTICRAS